MDLSFHFARPRGPLAPVVGWILSVANRRVNRWTVELLALRPDDAVVEVGFGPGAAIALAAERVTVGRLAGVDPSATMLSQACRRNRNVEKEGRLDLRRGVAESLPWPEETYSRAFTVNSIHEWSDVRRGLRELHRVLAPGGTVAVTTQARWLAKRPRRIRELGEIYRAHLGEVGFVGVELQLRSARPTPALCLMGRKSGAGVPDEDPSTLREDRVGGTATGGAQPLTRHPLLSRSRRNESR